MNAPSSLTMNPPQLPGSPSDGATAVRWVASGVNYTKLINLKNRMEAWRESMRTRGSLRRSQRAAINGERIGFGLAVAGGLVAFAALIGLIFVPVATFPVLYAEFFAVLGIILLVIGILFEASD